MNTEQNKTIVRRYFEEIVNRGRLDVTHELFAPEYASDSAHSTLRGPQLAAHAAHHLRQVFPDIHCVVNHILAEGDEVVVHVSFTGTQQGEFLGLPASGRRVTIHGAEQARLKDGKIVAAVWHLYDSSELTKPGK